MRVLILIAVACLVGFVIFKQREAVVRLRAERDEALAQVEEAKRILADTRSDKPQAFVPRNTSLQTPAAPEQDSSWMWDSKKSMSTLDDR